MLKKTTLLATSAILAASLATPAMAQVDEVIVTATKRATTLQDVPVAVTVTSAATIEKAAILDLQDLQSVVPSLRVNTLQSSQNTNFVIRGFGNGANNAGIEPSVGVFVDGVYRSRSAASIGDLPKLERVEVLSGPQSTLFGKNASAGVISVVTPKPQFEKSGFVELGIGNYNARNVKGYYTGPLGGEDSNVAYSVSGTMTKRDGYVKSNLGLDDVNNKNRFGVRGQLLLEPTDNASFRIIADYSELDENCCHVTNLTESPVTGLIDLLGGPGRSIADARNPFAYIAYQNKDSENNLKDAGISLQGDISFDNFDLTTITAFRSNDSFYDTDADYSEMRSLDVSSDQSVDTFTQEVRLASNSGEMFDWMVGGYLFLEDVKQVGGLEYGPDLRNYIDALAGGAATLAGIQGLYPGSEPFFGDQIRTIETFTQDDTAYSLFGTVDYHVNDRLTLTGGLNYTSDKKEVTGMTDNNDSFSQIDFDSTPTVFGISFVDFNITQAASLAPTQASVDFLQTFAPATYNAILAGTLAAIAPLRGLQFQPQFVSFPNNVENGETDDDKITYNLRAAYEVNDAINVYGSVSTGFKSSSWNLSRDSRPLAGTILGNLEQPNQNFGTRFSKPEEAFVVELGLKTKFENGYLNMAIFDQYLENFQANSFVGTSFVLTNAGETNVKGIEFDLGYRLIENLDLKFAGTLLDAEFTDYRDAPGPVPGVPIDLTGQTPSNINEVSLSVAATYNHEFANGWDGYVRGDYQYESDTEIANTLSPDALALRAAATGTATTFQYPGYDERGQNMLNLSAGLDFQNGLSAQIWGRNVTNDEFIQTLFPGVAQEGIINGYPNAPRTYGLSVRKTW